MRVARLLAATYHRFSCADLHDMRGAHARHATNVRVTCLVRARPLRIFASTSVSVWESLGRRSFLASAAAGLLLVRGLRRHVPVPPGQRDASSQPRQIIEVGPEHPEQRRGLRATTAAGPHATTAHLQLRSNGCKVIAVVVSQRSIITGSPPPTSLCQRSHPGALFLQAPARQRMAALEIGRRR